MHHPVVGDNWFKKKAREFVSFSEKWWVKNFLGPVLFVLPPMLATAVAMRPALYDEAVKILGQTVGDALGGSGLLIFLVAFIYIAVLRAALAGIEYYSRPARELGSKDILAILGAINLVVGDKNKRFGAHLKRQLKVQVVNPGVTFLEITRPDQQIALLITGLKTVFEYIDEENAAYRVGLLRIENAAPTEWVAFEPASQPPRTPPAQLAAPSSTVSYSIRTRSIVVIEDIQAELNRKGNKKERRYLRSNTQESDQGSQLCYPINHGSTGSVEYVITIAGNKKACLIEKHAELYAWIIENFSARISLEHSLMVLKEKANVQAAA